MNKKSTAKKLLLTTILTSGLAFAISEAAIAAPGYPGNALMPCQAQQMAPEMQEKMAKFLEETKESRKALAQKRAAMRAIMHAQTPDPAMASKVAGELFELRETLRLKSQEYGVPFPMFDHDPGSMMPKAKGGKPMPPTPPENQE
ncbi:hypothetical protein [Desulfogranum japonicum]|uniref:hypothetical protein n=1 Tax=Desulfogranum japonicum TaxID=231447 RepID=UPI00041AB47F|nr:hypothetical protein [Desulfogranum japonicum]